MSDQLRSRFRATLHYDGAAFRGWQLQPEERTVQGVLERRLARLLGASTRVRAAGRTDAGVHAVGQEIAFDAPSGWSAAELRRALNATVPGELWVAQLSATSDDFHPRFDATGRRYEYVLGTGGETASPLLRGRLWPLGRDAEPTALNAASSELVGERSFAGFAKSGQPGRGTRCRVEEAVWWRSRADRLHFRIVADRFLHRMVRYIVATLAEVATGRRQPSDIGALLAGEPGVRPPAPAPACGLYLTGVRYAEGWNRPPGVPGFEAPAPPDAGRTPDE